MTSMGIRAIAEEVGVSPHTLRYYEKTGLMITVPRDAGGRRVYSADHVRWMNFLLRLREGGMGIAQIREYARLTRTGADPDGSRRREILRTHRDQVKEMAHRLALHLEVLDRKVGDGCAPRLPKT